MKEMLPDSIRFDCVIWSQLCALEAIGEDYWCGGYNISIVGRNGKYGLIYTQQLYDENRQENYCVENPLCNCYYDSLYNLNLAGEPSGCFVCFSEGKCGLILLRCYADRDDIVDCTLALPCVYDHISAICGTDTVLACVKGVTTHYYDLDSKFLSDGYESVAVKCGVAICGTDTGFSIVELKTNTVIYQTIECNFLSFLCYYKNGLVFRESHGALEIAEPGLAKESGRLIFYNRSTGGVFVTEVFKNLKVFTRHDGLAGAMLGFTFELAGSEQTMLVEQMKGI